jgi:hypothetical protein
VLCKRQINHNIKKDMTIKEAIRQAEADIEEILDCLEADHNVRAYSIRITSTRGEDAEVMINEDAKGGRYS